MYMHRGYESKLIFLSLIFKTRNNVTAILTGSQNKNDKWWYDTCRLSQKCHISQCLQYLISSTKTDIQFQMCYVMCYGLHFNKVADTYFNISTLFVFIRFVFIHQCYASFLVNVLELNMIASNTCSYIVFIDNLVRTRWGIQPTINKWIFFKYYEKPIANIYKMMQQMIQQMIQKM